LPKEFLKYRWSIRTSLSTGFGKWPPEYLCEEEWLKKRAILISVDSSLFEMSDSPLTIGIDFGGTTVKLAVVFQGHIIDHSPPIATQDFSGHEELMSATEQKWN
jgi:activator of 2-hydroxyglutaryl-CoA dehydratase